MGFSVGSINECLLSFIYMFDYNSKRKKQLFYFVVEFEYFADVGLKVCKSCTYKYCKL